MLIIMAVLSLAIGNVTAIAQTNLKAHARVFDDLAHGFPAARRA
jgi:hypothetical protein